MYAIRSYYDVNTCLKYLPQRESEPRTIWQSGLDSTIFFKPSLVENHNTGEKEILVQDKANNLYLIANNGKILWKKKLESPILGEVFQIDFYRNSKFAITSYSIHYTKLYAVLPQKTGLLNQEQKQILFSVKTF